MARVLIAYATGEGQTAKVCEALARQWEGLGHAVQLADLNHGGVSPDPAGHDAVLVAASVHAGLHQKAALRFVQAHRDALTQRPAAFLSVSMSAAARTETGRAQADEQIEAFLKEAEWWPPLRAPIAGALHHARLSRVMRFFITVMQRLFRKELARLGWPDDLRRDEEFTDWDNVRRFGERFAAELASKAHA